MGNKYSGIFTQGYGIGAPPQANMMQQYRTPAGVTPPMALPVPIAPTSNAPTTTPYVLPMLQRVAQAAAQRRQAEERAVTAPAAAAAGIGAGTEAAGMPTSISDAFGSGLMSPTGRAITGASLAGLAAGGWSPTPVSLGQGIASMGAAAQKGYLEGKKAELEEAARKAAADKAAFDRRLQMAQFFQREREISGVKSKEAKANEINQVKLERDLRKDFETYSKPFTEAQRFFKDVINFSGEDNTSAQDLALVFSYMKLLDPGSVVREGEQYQVRDLGSIPDSFRVMLSRYGFFQDPNSPEGKMLLPQSVRNSIREASMEKYSDALGSQLEVESEYSGYGKRADLNKNYFRPKIQQNGSIKSPYLVNSVEEGEAKAKSGEYFVVSGDGFYRKD